MLTQVHVPSLKLKCQIVSEISPHCLKIKKKKYGRKSTMAKIDVIGCIDLCLTQGLQGHLNIGHMVEKLDSWRQFGEIIQGVVPNLYAKMYSTPKTIPLCSFAAKPLITVKCECGCIF